MAGRRRPFYIGKILMQKNLTEGSILKNIVVFSLPYLLSYFLQTLYGMADLFLAGQFNGADVISAVSIGSQVPFQCGGKGTIHRP